MVMAGPQHDLTRFRWRGLLPGIDCLLLVAKLLPAGLTKGSKTGLVPLTCLPVPMVIFTL